MLLLALSLTALAAEPVLEAVCMEPARISSAPPLPTAPNSLYAPSVFAVVGEVRTVDAAGTVTVHPVQPAGAVVIAADAGAPATAVVAEIAALPAPRYVALAVHGAPPPCPALLVGEAPVALFEARDPDRAPAPDRTWGSVWMLATDVPLEELTALRIVPPDYPRVAVRRGLGTHRCLVKVSVANDGVPYALEIAPGCPPEFHRAIERALMKWRWEPPRWLGEPTKAQTTVAVTFRPQP